MMKKLKVLLLMMVLALGVAFYVPTVNAQEPTTEDTELILDEDTTLNDIGDWITALSLGFLSSATFSAVGGVILNALKKKALNEVNKAVDNNNISQATANKATQIIESSVIELQNKLNLMTEKFNELAEKTSQTNDKMELIIEKYEERDSQLAELIEETMGDGESE